MKILVIRNDKLGDFMLTWPALAVIKHYCPDAHITALVPCYTKPMAEMCPWIDEIITDHDSLSPLQLARIIKKKHFGALLTLFSTGRVALAGFLAGVPYRLAPATKVAQLLYNQRLVQRRSRSVKPEFAYNLDLAYRLIYDFGQYGQQMSARASLSGDWLPGEIQRPLLIAPIITTGNDDDLMFSKGLADDSPLVFIHPGTGGSANNLSPLQYAQLANHIAEAITCRFIITYGPGEATIAQETAQSINTHATVHTSKNGLAGFVQTLRHADLFISGSTGPLHIAGAMNLQTATFYPGHRSATPLRWQTLNAPERRLAFTPPPTDERNVGKTDITAAAQAIVSHFFT